MAENKVVVFLVEDDRIYLRGLQNFLQEHLGDQAELKTFENGESCLAALDVDPKLIVLDYHLDSEKPGAMDGLATMQAIRSRLPEVTVIMLSSQESYQVASQSIAGGANHYIIKDETAADQLLDHIKEAVS